MSRRPLFGALALLFAAAGLTAALTPQDKSKSTKPASAPAADDEMMAKWTAFMTPGPEHKVLDAKAGRWTDKVQMWMEPGTPPQESTGASEYKWIMGGRYLQGTTQGSAMGMPFEGMATAGFDNLKKKYFWTWFDNMGTGFMMSEGTYDAATKTFNYKGEGPDCMAGKYVTIRTVEQSVDPNTWKMEMFGPDKTGKEYKMMEITSTRAK